jgi:hypothetical protein
VRGHRRLRAQSGWTVRAVAAQMEPDFAREFDVQGIDPGQQPPLQEAPGGGAPPVGG